MNSFEKKSPQGYLKQETYRNHPVLHSLVSSCKFMYIHMICI